MPATQETRRRPVIIEEALFTIANIDIEIAREIARRTGGSTATKGGDDFPARPVIYWGRVNLDTATGIFSSPYPKHSFHEPIDLSGGTIKIRGKSAYFSRPVDAKSHEQEVVLARIKGVFVKTSAHMPH